MQAMLCHVMPNGKAHDIHDDSSVQADSGIR